MGNLVNPFILFPAAAGGVPDFVIGGFSNGLSTLNANAFLALNINLFPPSTAAKPEAPIIENSTLKNYTCEVSTNSSSGSADELRSYISGSDGNGSISIAVATTGVFQDTSNTDSVTQGGDFAFHFIEGTTASIKFISLAFEVAA